MSANSPANLSLLSELRAAHKRANEFTSPFWRSQKQPVNTLCMRAADRIEELEEMLMSVLDKQVGGDHYKALGQYQPIEVLKNWLTDEEFKGYCKGTAIVYLCREADKNGMEDIEKAIHTLELFAALYTEATIKQMAEIAGES